MSDRTTLHRLIDILPQEHLPTIVRLLEPLAATPASRVSTAVLQPAAFDTAGASDYLGGVYTKAALVKRRQRGLGPPFRRDEAGRILYLQSDLDRFLQSLPKG